MEAPKIPVVANPWQQLRRFTQARIALGRVGGSVPTQPHLEFQLAHARARDAVHHPLDVDKLKLQLTKRNYKVLALHSAAENRQTYLQRPDLGRRLAPDSRKLLETWSDSSPGGYDLAIVVADGLSAFAIEENAVSFLEVLNAKLNTEKLRVAPLAIVEQGRVAIGDEVGEALHAEIVIVLIGERPGLSSPDSMGIYLTYRPRAGRTDAERNCISNIRREGLSYEVAAHKLHYLIREARSLRLSGVGLKDEADATQEISLGRNFLVAPK